MAQTRRGLATGAAMLVAFGACATPSKADVGVTPITAAGSRLKYLSALSECEMTADEDYAVTVEQCELSDTIENSEPQTLLDAIIVLMAAAAATSSDTLHDDGTFGHEHGDIMVRRVMRFLAGHVGADLADFGGTWFLTSDEHEALAFKGTIAQAAARFHTVDPTRALERETERRILEDRQLRLAGYRRLPEAER